MTNPKIGCIQPGFPNVLFDHGLGVTMGNCNIAIAQFCHMWQRRPDEMVHFSFYRSISDVSPLTIFSLRIERFHEVGNPEDGSCALRMSAGLKLKYSTVLPQRQQPMTLGHRDRP